MPNPYYNHGSAPGQQAPLSSAIIRAEFDSITAGFALLPTLAGNAIKTVRIGAGANALVAVNPNWPVAATFDPTSVGGVYEMNAAGVTISPNVFAAGDIVRLLNNSAGSLVITQDTGMVLHFAGSGATGNRNLAQWGFAFIWYVGPSTAVIFGFGVS